MNTFVIIFCITLALGLTNGWDGWTVYNADPNKNVDIVDGYGKVVDDGDYANSYIREGSLYINPMEITTELISFFETSEDIPEESKTWPVENIAYLLQPAAAFDTLEIAKEIPEQIIPKKSTKRLFKRRTTTQPFAEEATKVPFKVVITEEPTEEFIGPSEPGKQTHTQTEGHNIENDLPPECRPPGGSMQSKQDLVNIIDFVSSNELQVVDKINQSYFDNAVAIRTKLEKNIASFISWLKDRPQHLKHNLRDIRNIRNKIQPKMDNFNKDMEKFPKSVGIYHDKKQAVDKLKKEVEFVKSICTNNCGPRSQQINFLSKDWNEAFYCAPIKDIYQKVTTDMKHFINSTTDDMIHKLEEDEKEYDKEIKRLKEELKYLALKTFGHTMYDILNLLDDYHHIEEKFKDVGGVLYNVSNEFIEITLTLSTAQHAVKQLKQLCFSCNNEFSRLRFQKLLQKNLLDKLIQENQTIIRERLNEVYLEIFVDLNKKVRITDEETQKFIDNLKPIEEEISKITTEETKIYNDLIQTLNLNRYDDVLALDSSTKTLNKVVMDMKDEVEDLIRKYKKN